MSKSELDKIDNINDETGIKHTYEALKRLADVLIAAISIVVFSPIMLIVMLIIRLDSKGPVIFGHTRIGKNGEKIKVYKFRTMYENSKELFEQFTPEQKKEYEENFKLDNDPRVTKVGRFLRKTSLDELPQLLNILKGNMSIVGPRPIVDAEKEKYGIYFDKLISVTPGLTGYWQANGRSDTTYEERVQMDMYYIDNRSILMDIKIILKTFISVIKKEGAV